MNRSRLLVIIFFAGLMGFLIIYLIFICSKSGNMNINSQLKVLEKIDVENTDFNDECFNNFINEFQQHVEMFILILKTNERKIMSELFNCLEKFGKIYAAEEKKAKFSRIEKIKFVKNYLNDYAKNEKNRDKQDDVIKILSITKFDDKINFFYDITRIKTEEEYKFKLDQFYKN
ncbi:hypothetical protein H311_01309 [Anncaliia algerae PRA109]|nr:hypothetical protein H311_01309 [Anncaliia algerae PRA109]